MISSRNSRRHGWFAHPCSVTCRALWLMVFLALVSASFAHAAARVLRGQVSAAIRNLTPVDRLNAAKHLGLGISLPLRDPEGLTNLLRGIDDPASTNYHHYRTTEQFTVLMVPAPS